MITKLEQGEKLLTETRRHWFVFVSEVVGLAITALAPFALLFAMHFAGIDIAHERIWPLWMFFTAAWFLMLWILFWKIWTSYYLDVWYVTDRRLIDVEQYWLFKRRTSELRLDKIQDITVEVHGLLPHLLKFGTIHVQTAGQARKIDIINIPNPHRLKDIIWKAHEERIANMTKPGV
jgi:membrane protein YdbS with pleckstrin-like domain